MLPTADPNLAYAQEVYAHLQKMYGKERAYKAWVKIAACLMMFMEEDEGPCTQGMYLLTKYQMEQRHPNAIPQTWKGHGVN